jgi:hypothetical protein
MKNYMVTYADAASTTHTERRIVLSEDELTDAKKDICNRCPYKFGLCDNYCRNGIVGSEEGTPTDLEPTIVRIEEV